MWLLCSVHCTLIFYQTSSHCHSEDTSQDRQGSLTIPLRKQHFAELQLGLHFISGTSRNIHETVTAPKYTGPRAQMPLQQLQHIPPGQTLWAHKGSLYPLAREQRSLPDAESCGNWEMAMGELWENKNRLIKVLPFTDHVELLCSLVSFYSYFLDKEPK